MDPTDVAAWIGAAAGVCALVWQAATRRLPTHRVKVTRSHAWIVWGDEIGETMLGIYAQNVGAGPVTVTGWGIDIGNGNLNATRSVPGATPLPHRLEPGADGGWYLEADKILAVARERGLTAQDAKRWRAWVSLGTGQKIYAKRGVPVLF
jgi:hypothetical protein